MADLILIVLSVEKAMRAKTHNNPFLWYAGKLLKCTKMASAVGWLDWSGNA
jgi:hypothetical protein